MLILLLHHLNIFVAAFALWFPKCYTRIHHDRSQLQQKLPNLTPNFANSVYSCCTANFGEQTATYIHTDPQNDAAACCAITAGGDYNPALGGHLILWDLGLIIEFPPGSTILIPSALFRHSNVPVQKGETRVSFTQYTAGGIRRWLEYGGRTEDAFAAEDPEEFARMMEERPRRWEKVLSTFNTLAELKSGIIN